jgi:two-component SAPR family response regulator
MLAEQLSEIGYIVVGPAFELKEARQLAEVSSIDAALLDLNLHGLFAGQVADILARRQILFLFITGYDRPPAGFHENIGFLNKPFQTAELRRAVEGLLSFPANSDRRRSGAA